MPKVLDEQGFRFSFFASDGSEPPHVHVVKEEGRGKWWLDPVSRDRARGFSSADLLKIERIIRKNQGYMLQR